MLKEVATKYRIRNRITKPIVLLENQISMSVASRCIKKEDTPFKSYVANRPLKCFLVPRSTISYLSDELGFCTNRKVDVAVNAVAY
jgi:hypothetical protein